MTHLTYKQYLAITLTSLFIYGCGGGDDEESAYVPPTPEVTPPPVSEDPTSLDDLIVAPENKLDSIYMLNIDIDLSLEQRAYFSLCDDFSPQQDSYTVNYDSCLFRGPLDQGYLNTDIKTANHQTSLIGVVWFYDGQDPVYQTWQPTNSGAPIFKMR